MSRPGDDTFVALLTPLAPGAIAVVRLAGLGVDAILSRILRRPHDDAPPELRPSCPTFCRLVDEAGLIDDAVVVRGPACGVPWAEICTHGGVRVVQRTVALFEACGACVVEAPSPELGMGSTCAVERAVDAALLRAASRRLASWLLSQRRVLPTYLGRLASLDEHERAAFRKRTAAAIRLVAGLRIALIGPTNAGKSTLANRLIGRPRVITSAEAGTTRDWVSEAAFVDGWPVTLIDTAGFSGTTGEIEAEAVRRGVGQAAAADVSILVLDALAPVDAVAQAFETARSAPPVEQPLVVVVNKCDAADGAAVAGSVAQAAGQSTAAGESSAAGAASRAPGESSAVARPGGRAAVPAPICISAMRGDGIARLEACVAAALGLDQLDESLPTGFLPEHL